VIGFRSGRGGPRPGNVRGVVSSVLHVPRCHVYVKKARMQAADLLTQGNQFVLFAFTFPTQNLSK
jgi:hypothetical protein